MVSCFSIIGSKTLPVGRGQDLFDDEQEHAQAGAADAGPTCGSAGRDRSRTN